MNEAFMDAIDEVIQDLNETGFEQEAEYLYQITYETEWSHPAEMAREAGQALLKFYEHRGDELPPQVLGNMETCMNLIKRSSPEISFDQES